jgi:hypothetical protein
MPAPEWPFIFTPEEFGVPSTTPDDAQASAPASPLPTAPTPAASPAPVSAPGTSQSETQAEVARIFADPERTLESTQRALDLLRTLGPEYRQVSGQIGPLSVGAPADTTPPTGAVSDPVLAEVMEPTTPAEAFVAAAPEIGIAHEEAKAWATWAETQPSGGNLQEALIGWPEDAHDEVAELAELGWKALDVPLSVRATAELHGLHYRSKAFNALVEIGMQVKDEEARRLKLAETRPGNARTNDPGQRRTR